MSTLRLRVVQMPLTKFVSILHMVLKEMLFEQFQDGCYSAILKIKTSVLDPICLKRKSMDDRILLDFPTGSELDIENGGLHLDYFH